jgi:hypothetical protein
MRQSINANNMKLGLQQKEALADNINTKIGAFHTKLEAALSTLNQQFQSSASNHVSALDEKLPTMIHHTIQQQIGAIASAIASILTLDQSQCKLKWMSSAARQTTTSQP